MSRHDKRYRSEAISPTIQSGRTKSSKILWDKKGLPIGKTACHSLSSRRRGQLHKIYGLQEFEGYLASIWAQPCIHLPRQLGQPIALVERGVTRQCLGRAKLPFPMSQSPCFAISFDLSPSHLQLDNQK